MQVTTPSGDSLSSICVEETPTAQANICSLDDIFLLDSESLGQYVAASVVGILNKAEALRPYYEELWRRFSALKEGETICGCATRTEYCEKILHKTIRSVQHVLYGRPEKQLPAPAPVPIFLNSPCPVCQDPQPSKSAWGRHVRESHPDEADGILGEQDAPQATGGSIRPSSTTGNAEVSHDSEDTEPTPRTERETSKIKPIDYKPNSFHVAKAPKEPKPTEVFYVIQRKSNSLFLCGPYITQFSKADALNMFNVRRFPKPVEYSCVYHVPEGKRKEVELDRSEWRWVKVSIQIEPLE